MNAQIFRVPYFHADDCQRASAATFLAVATGAHLEPSRKSTTEPFYENFSR